MIAIIDYDAGNLKSVEKAFQFLGENSLITREENEILRADKVVLPGVGSFGDAMDKLHQYGLTEVIRKVAGRGTPFWGFVWGFSFFFSESEESPGVSGLGVLRGKIVRIPDAPGLKIPHIGWNSLEFPRESRLFQGIDEEAYVYFVHSYYLQAEDPKIVAATTRYGVPIHAAVECQNVFACQFHPEKSSRVGLKILENFAKLS